MIGLSKKIAFIVLIFSLSCKGQNLLDEKSYTEEDLYRPNFHFTPKKNWMNDPNGMFYINGCYHLYYQYYPDGNKWGPMHWGHTISKDLVKWDEQPIALFPDHLGYIFSGSAVVDNKNTSGLGDGKNTPIVAIYTYHDPVKEKANQIDVESQGMAYSLDNGFTWEKYKNNPIVKNPGIQDFRDPKVLWDAIHKQWILVLAAHDRVKFYRSDDLKDWEYLSDFGVNFGAHDGVWECPDFFSMKVEKTGEIKWILIQSLNPGGPNGGSGTQYFVGDFDGKNFILDKTFVKTVENKKAIWLDYGKDNYAGVTWNNIPKSDGRKLMIGWMANWDYAQEVPTVAWRNSMTIPRELTLLRTNKGYHINVQPVREIESYISKTIKKGNITVNGPKLLVDNKTADFTKAEIKFRLKNLEKNSYSFAFVNQAGEQIVFGINNNENYLFVDRSKSGKIEFSKKFALSITKAQLDRTLKTADIRILIDKTSIEIFFNNGEKVITETFFPTEPFTDFKVLSTVQTEISNLIINQFQFN